MHKPNKYRMALSLWPGETNEYGVVGIPLLPFNIHDYYYGKGVDLVSPVCQ
jgi:hypothetical protein